jgi:hypothetical protein
MFNLNDLGRRAAATFNQNWGNDGGGENQAGETPPPPPPPPPPPEEPNPQAHNYPPPPSVRTHPSSVHSVVDEPQNSGHDVQTTETPKTVILRDEDIFSIGTHSALGGSSIPAPSWARSPFTDPLGATSSPPQTPTPRARARHSSREPSAVALGKRTMDEEVRFSYDLLFIS